MGVSERLDLRCFLEGVEVPCVSAVIQIVPNAPAMCSIQVVPTDEVLELKDRTVVHLYWSSYVPGDLAGNPPLSRYKLGFSGEMRAIQISKQVGARSAVLQCEDVSAYWDQCMQYVGNYASGGDGFWDRTSSFLGANKGLFDNVLRGPELMMSNIVNGKSATRPEATGLFAGVLRLLERMGGVYKSGQPFRGLNDFYSAAELRMRIIDQIGAAEKDTTSARLVRQKTFINWISNTMGSFGSLITYRDILKVLFQFIFYEGAPNPMARYVQPAIKKQAVYANVPIDTTLASKFSFSKFFRLRDQLRAFEKEQNKKKKLDVGTSAKFSSVQERRLAAFIGTTATLIGELEKAGKHYTITSLTKALRLVLKELGTAKAAAKKGNGKDPKTQQSHFESMSYALGRASLRMDEANKLVVTRRRAVRTITSGRASLYTQLMFPDLYFAPPPKCNVIFPEMQLTTSYSIDYRRQVTRMRVQLKHWLEGRGSTAPFGKGQLQTKLLGIYYYAPEVLGVRKRMYLSSNHGFARIVMPHERFSGIIPSIQTLGRVNFYVARKDAAYKKRGGGIPYAQKTVNFKFFRDRYNARTMNVVCKFSPQLVCGLPAVVLDRYSTATTADPYNFSDVTGKGVKRPKQYLGRINRLVHTLAQDNSTTAVGMQTCRTHDESVEIIGAGELDKLKSTRTKNPKTIPRRGEAKRRASAKNLAGESKLLQESLEKLRDASPFTLAALKKRFDAAADQANEMAFIAERARLIQIAKVMNRVQSAVRSAQSYLAQNQILLAKSNLQHAVSMASSIKDFAPGTGTVSPERVPAEELLRPPWYDPVFDNNRIGPEFYQQLLGCGSITDRIAVKQAQGNVEWPTVTASTVQLAIDQLVELYGALSRTDGNVIGFMREYTKREIATFEQVMGNQGFHRHAFGDKRGFDDILQDPLMGVENASQTIKKIDPALDVRAERREAVLAYRRSLKPVILG